MTLTASIKTVGGVITFLSRDRESIRNSVRRLLATVEKKEGKGGQKALIIILRMTGTIYIMLYVVFRNKQVQCITEKCMV